MPPTTTKTTTTTTTPPTPPNQSLYLSNLPEKLPKPALRRALYTLCATYGPVLDITALKTPAMRGQAHVLFRDTHTATQALRALEGTDFCGRGLRIAYSRNRSGTLARLTGTVGVKEGMAEGGKAGGAAAAASSVSAFPPPPGAMPAAKAVGALPPPPGLPAKLAAPAAVVDGAPSPQGTKRAREEESGGEEDGTGDAEMEGDGDDDDDDGAMDMSEDEG
ncbi:hypothetical protein LTR08_009061 [Meristemomyces frigidus]|nr:hypothetical protein LTR08_009061 [Meristemomyces frigidus]